MQPEFWDISVPITEEMPAWPESAGLTLTRVHDLSRGDAVNEPHIALGAHAGTHIDAPLHFLADGKPVDELPLSALIGAAVVIEVSSCSQIEAGDLQAAISTPVKRVLLKTSNSAKWQQTAVFDRDYVALSPDAATWLVEQGVALVGIDYLSVEVFGGNGDVHRTLLGAGVVIVEGLDLHAVEPGEYWLSCLPMRLTGAEGAPARAVLMRPIAQGVAA